MIYQKSILFLLLGFCLLQLAGARDIYVAKTGDDGGAGNAVAPYATISKAAQEAMPGDTVWVRGGVYREWVKPASGGLSEDKRIVYKAYPGETPVIKGSERITNWVKESGNVWRADIEDSFFGSYNPYTINLSGDYLLYGQENHLGEVYLNEESFFEKFARNDINNEKNTWFTSHSGNTTKIWANFGGEDPNAGLAEINVRECVFAPTKVGLNYITVDGFTMLQAAPNWLANKHIQRAMVLTMAGHHWIIQNCRLSHSKCAGISAAQQTAQTTDIEKLGHHIVRYNLIEKCGQSGISGTMGWSRSLIERNIIQDINSKKQFGGHESGGIKFHYIADLVIKNNIIRRINAGGKGNYPGIWVDWRNQGIRITGNVIYDVDRRAILVEMNRGRNLIDNNIIMSAMVHTCSERLVMAHNLFYNSGMVPVPGMPGKRSVNYYEPHTVIRTGESVSPKVNLGDRYYNNIYIGQGSAAPHNSTDFVSDYNVFYDGAKKNFGNDNSIVDNNFKTDFSYTEDSNSVTIMFNANSTLNNVDGPLVNYDLIGLDPLVNHGIENRDGNPITIDDDIFGNPRDLTHPMAGPLEAIKPGQNVIRFVAGPQANKAPSQVIPSKRIGDFQRVKFPNHWPMVFIPMSFLIKQ